MYRVIFATALAGLIAAPLATYAQTRRRRSRQRSWARRGARERQKKCAAEWKEAKSADKVEAEMKWPQFWSACNKRLKAAG